MSLQEAKKTTTEMLLSDLSKLKREDGIVNYCLPEVMAILFPCRYSEELEKQKCRIILKNIIILDVKFRLCEID